MKVMVEVVMLLKGARYDEPAGDDQCVQLVNSEHVDDEGAAGHVVHGGGESHGAGDLLDLW